jgi:uncharacterized membrane protein
MLASISRIKENRSSLIVVLAVSGVLFLAIVVRLIGLGSESAWIDEAYSINLAQHSISKIIQGTAADQHPPFYYLLLHFWMLFGNSVSHARLLSALLGIVLILQVMIFGWNFAGARLGIGAALLLTLSPLQVWYSQEARQYMLLACLTTASTYELWSCLQGRRRWLLYWLFSTMAIYTQYFAVFIFFSHAVIVCLWAYQQHNIRLIVPWVISMIGVGVVFAPWTPTALNQFLYHTMPWISDPAVGQVRDVVLILLFGNGVQVLPIILRWIWLLGLFGVAGWAVYRLINISQESQRGFVFVALWALIPFLAISLLASFYPVFQLKQYLILLAPFLLLATWATLIIPRPWGGLFFAGLALAGGMTLIYQQNVLTKDDWRGVATYIQNNKKPGDLVYGNPAASAFALDLYWKTPLPYNGYPINYDILSGGWEGVAVTSDIADQQLSTVTKNLKRVWLVEFFPEFWDENKQIPSWLAKHGNIVDEQSFGKIRLRLYKLNP